MNSLRVWASTRPSRSFAQRSERIWKSIKREHANEELREKLLRWLEENNEFEVPETLVERQIQIRMQRLLRDLSRQGINPQRLDVDWGKIGADQRQQAIRDVKGSLILEPRRAQGKDRRHRRRRRSRNRPDRNGNEQSTATGQGSAFEGFRNGTPAKPDSEQENAGLSEGTCRHSASGVSKSSTPLDPHMHRTKN